MDRCIDNYASHARALVNVGLSVMPLWSGACISGPGVGHGGPNKNPEIGNLSIFRILIPNLVSKVLY
jgi:hypothetical protein